VIGLFTAVVWVVNSNRDPVITGQVIYGTNCSLELLDGTPTGEVTNVACNGSNISWSGGRGHYVFSKNTFALPMRKCQDGSYQGGSNQGAAYAGTSYIRICTNFPGDPNNTNGLAYRVCAGAGCEEPEPECTSDIDCVDFSACTQDKCMNGSCENPAIVCDDSNACTTDSCDVDIGCKNVPKNCDDGSLCTTDSCNTETGQCSNVTRSCDDNDPCTIDRCASNEQCQHIARCPGPECPAQCQPSSSRPPDDDEPGNTCDLIHNPTQCMCEAGAFVGCLAEINCNGNLFVCDDGNDCTQDSCNPVGGECEHVPWAVPIQGCDEGGGADSGDDGGDTGGSSSNGSKSSTSKSSSSKSSVSSASSSKSSLSASSLSSASSQSSQSSRSSSRSSASSRSSSSSSSSSQSSSKSSRSSAVSSACTVPSGASLVTEWNFEAGNGTYAIDSSGYGHNGVLMGGASWTTFASPSPQRGSYALSLDGTDDRVLLTRENDDSFHIPSGTGSRTISLWARPNVDAGPLLALGSGNGAGQKFILELRIINGNVILFEDGVNQANTIQIPAAELPSLAGVWSHIAFTVNGSTGEWSYYLNGSLIKEGTFAVPIDTDVNEVEIGSRHDSSTAFFDGAIDDIHIYDRVLTQGEIDTLNDGCGSSRSSARISSSRQSSSRSSERSSLSSSRSSRMSSSRSSVSSIATACMGDECSRGGVEFCAGQGGICTVTAGLPCIQCIAGSSRSSRSSSPALAGFCGDNIVQANLGEDCDMGDFNVPPGTPGGTCSCTPGEDGCVSPMPGLIWFRGCEWPKCGDGEVNNLMLRSTEFVNFDLIREECDDGNFENGDGCSALCVDELRPAANSSRSSARSSTAPVCDANACADGGDEFCSAKGSFCSVTAGLPCIQCTASPVPKPASSRSSVKSSAGLSSAPNAIPRDECSACGTCGTGFANVCDEEECLNLGPCTFQGGIFSNSCLQGPQCQQAAVPMSSVSSARSSSRSSVTPAAGFCGDSIVQTSLGEECDMGDYNVPPGTPGGSCSCTPGEDGCISPIAGLIWFRGCQWPKCGDGEINNLMLRSTEFVNFDLMREECDDGNFENGDGCSALCIDESKAFSSKGSSRSSVITQNNDAACSMTVCAEGGTEFCSVQSPGSICVRTNTLPCVQCVGLPVTSSVSSSRASVNSSLSRASSASSLSSAPFIARQHGKLSAIVFIDTDRDGKLDSNEGQRFNGATISITGVTETGAIFTRVSKTGATGALILREIPFSRRANDQSNMKETDAVSFMNSPYYAALTALLAQVNDGYTVALVVPPGYIATTPENVTVPVTDADDDQSVSFGIATILSSSSVSSSSVRSSASNSSSIRSSSSSSSAAPVAACGGDECTAGGNELCNAQNMRCSPVNAEPCIVCLPYSSSSAAGVADVASQPSEPVLEPPQCGGNECFLGGQEVCAERNLDCVHTDTSPCIECVGVAPSSRTSRAPTRTIGELPVSPLPFSCSGNECAESGDVICGAKNADCRASNRNPCFTCTARPTSRAASQASVAPTPLVTTCGANECASGGDFFCSLQGFKCSPSNNFPCFTCEAAASSAARVVARTDVPVRVTPPTIPTIIPPPECVCANGQRCVDNVCLTPVQVTELPPFCGNARRDAGESCDEGSNNTDKPNAYCRRDCTFGRCGDRIVDTPLELCDDGNLTNGDGCSAQCLPERPLTPQEVESRTLPTSIIELPLQQPQTKPGQQIVQIPVSQLPGSVVTHGSSPQPPATADTGPAAIAVMAAGAAAGYSWMKRKRRG